MYTAKPDYEKMKLAPKDPNAGKIQPDRRWFGNVRTVDQKELEHYRKKLEEQEVRKGSGISVLVRNKKLPLSLVKDAFNKTLNKGDRLLQVESFHDTFGPLSRRKRPTIGTSNLEELLAKSGENYNEYNPENDVDLHKQDIHDFRKEVKHAVFFKG